MSRSFGDPGKVLSAYQVLAWRSCRCHVLVVLVWPLFWEALGNLLYQNIVRSFPSAAGPFMTILWDSLRSRGMKILVRVCQNLLQLPVRRSCGNPSEMVSGAFTGSCASPCEKLLKRSSWHPLGFLKWSRTGPCEKILWRSHWNPPQEVLQWDLEDALHWCLSLEFFWVLKGILVWRSCEILYIDP